MTDPEANVTVKYFSDGVLSAETRGYGTGSEAMWLYSYDPTKGAVNAILDPNGHATTFGYDANGNLERTRDALDRETYTRLQRVQPTVVHPKRRRHHDQLHVR